MSKPAIVLIGFNRPDLSQRSLDIVLSSGAEKLYIILDGPRQGNEKDYRLCEDVRAVFENIPRHVKVERLYSDINLGCGKRVSSGISAVLSEETAAVILEDDCHPSASYFEFAELMLEKYRWDNRIFSVSASNYLLKPLRIQASYYFTRDFYCHGWATWRRSWETYDYTLSSIANNTPSPGETYDWLDQEKFWEEKKHMMLHNPIDTWDYQATLLHKYLGFLSIVPKVNLLENVGFRSDATHTVAKSLTSDRTALELRTIKHPKKVQANKKADRQTFELECLHRIPSTATARAQRLLLRFARSLKQFSR